MRAIPGVTLTPAQITYAARLYAVAQVAHLDCGGGDTPDEEAVVMKAYRQARRALSRRGLAWPGLNSLQACIDAARRAA